MGVRKAWESLGCEVELVEVDRDVGGRRRWKCDAVNRVALAPGVGG